MFWKGFIFKCFFLFGVGLLKEKEKFLIRDGIGFMFVGLDYCCFLIMCYFYYDIRIKFVFYL